MSEARLRIRHAPRDPARYPRADDELGLALFDRVVEAVNRGQPRRVAPRPSLAVLGPELVDWYDVTEVLRLGAPRGPLLMSALAGQPEGECAALLGVFNLRRGARTAGRAAVAYLEWPDNRWWTAWQPLDHDGALIGEAPAIRRAVDGWPRPGGVGGWFATVRRLGIKPRIEMQPPADGWVH